MSNDSITRLNALNSPLLRLPAELRNQIYTYILSSPTIKLVTPLPGQLTGHTVHEKTTNAPIGLYRVCRQIATEALSLPCLANTIHFTAINTLIQNASALPPSQRAAVTHILVDIELSFTLPHPTNDFAATILDRNVPITAWFPNIEDVRLSRAGQMRGFSYLRHTVEGPLIQWFSNFRDGSIAFECRDDRDGPSRGVRDVLFTVARTKTRISGE